MAKSRLAAGALALVALAAAGGGYVWYHDYESKLAEQARVADAQRKADQDRAAADAAQHESKLEAELQAARDALQQAEASKRKAELDRVAAESAQREARLQGELNAAKDALSRAEQSGKKADLDSKSAAEALRMAERASRLGADRDAKNAVGAASKAAAAPQVVPKAGVAAAVAGVARFDGNYQGRFCNYNESKGGTTRCWNALLTAQDGKVSATWQTRYSTDLVRAKGTVAPDGTANLAVDGFLPDGRPLHGTLSGSLAGDKVTLSGKWHNGVGLNADLARVH